MTSRDLPLKTKREIKARGLPLKTKREIMVALSTACLRNRKRRSHEDSGKG